MTPPHLTRARWYLLRALKGSKVAQSRPFLPKEVVVTYDYRARPGTYERQATGPGMVSLEKAGWVKRVAWGASGQGMPFQSGGSMNTWQLTDAGREAIAACPDTFSGEPVYGNKR
jgi:hypothetical protein